jgi:flagellar motility protein MotE (MotC chaperone)
LGELSLLTTRYRELEQDFNRLQDTLLRERPNFEQKIQQEQIQSDDIINDMHDRFENTMNELVRKFQHTENVLQETESLLQTDREAYRSREILYRKREEELIRYLQNSTHEWTVYANTLDLKQKQLEFQILDLQARPSDLESLLRTAKQETKDWEAYAIGLKGEN